MSEATPSAAPTPKKPLEATPPAHFDHHVIQHSLDLEPGTQADCCQLVSASNALFVCSYNESSGVAQLHLFKLHGIRQPELAWSLPIPKNEIIAEESPEGGEGATKSEQVNARAICVTAGENSVAIGLNDGRVVLLPLPPSASQEFIIAARHQAAVNCMARGGDALFSADAIGQICRIHVPYVLETHSSFTPMIKSIEPHAIVSMEVEDDLLVASLATRHIIVKGAVSCTMTSDMVPEGLPNDARTAFEYADGTPPLDVRWLGSKPHSGVMTASLATRSPGALVARPGGRMWIANAAEGAVQSTIRFSAALPGRLQVVGDTSVLAWAKSSEGPPHGVVLCDLIGVSYLTLLESGSSTSFVAYDAPSRTIAVLGQEEDKGAVIHFVVLRDSPREILSLLMDNQCYTSDLLKCLQLVIECVPPPQVQTHSAIGGHPEAGRCRQTIAYLQPLIDGVGSVDAKDIPDGSPLHETLTKFRKLAVALEDASGGSAKAAFPKLNTLHKPLGQFPRVAGLDADAKLVEQALAVVAIDDLQSKKVVKRDVHGFPPVRNLPDIKDDDVAAADADDDRLPTPDTRFRGDVNNKNLSNAYSFSHAPARQASNDDHYDTGLDTDTDTLGVHSTASSSTKPPLVAGGGNEIFINPHFVRNARQAATKRKRKLAKVLPETSISSDTLRREISGGGGSPTMKLPSGNSKASIINTHSLVVSDFVDLFTAPDENTKQEFLKKAAFVLSECGGTQAQAKVVDDQSKIFSAALVVVETACRYYAGSTYWPFINSSACELFDSKLVDELAINSAEREADADWRKAVASMTKSGHLVTCAKLVWTVPVMCSILEELLLPWPEDHAPSLSRLFVIVNGLGPAWTGVATKIRRAATATGIVSKWLPKEVTKGANISPAHARHAALKKLRPSSSPFFLHYVLPSLLSNGAARSAPISYDVVLAAFPAVLPWNLAVWGRIHTGNFNGDPDPLADRRFVEYLRRLMPAILKHTPKGFDTVVRDCAKATMGCLLDSAQGVPVDAGERDGLADLLLARHGKMFTKSELAKQRYLPGLLSAIRSESPKPRARSNTSSRSPPRRSRSQSPQHLSRSPPLSPVDEFFDMPAVIVSSDKNVSEAAESIAATVPPLLLRIPPQAPASSSQGLEAEDRQASMQAVPMVSNFNGVSTLSPPGVISPLGDAAFSPGGGNNTFFTESVHGVATASDVRLCYGVSRFGGENLMEASDASGEEGDDTSPQSIHSSPRKDGELPLDRTLSKMSVGGGNRDDTSAFNRINNSTKFRGVSGATIESDRCQDDLRLAASDLARTLQSSCSQLPSEDAKNITSSAYSHTASCLPTYPARNVHGWSDASASKGQHRQNATALPIADWLRSLTEVNRQPGASDQELAQTIVAAFTKSRS